MSSSRSIAAARNRRAGGEPPQISRTRPNTSIASQAAFSQQPMQQNRKMAPNNAPRQLQQTNKISISDAIGLITIRLGRVEQYIQDSHEKGDVGFSGSENLQLIDKDVIHSLTERIYSLENKPSSQPVNVTQITNQIAVLEKELNNLKSFLDGYTKKTDDFITETEQRFTDVDVAFADLEKSLPFSSVVETENIQLEVEETEKEDLTKGPTFSSVDLKNVIEEELANAEI
jgi:uncharacterized coiled-coil protein SlyX